MRVVSLIPAATEIVHALGAGDRLVGRSHECDHPPGVDELPACTASKLDADGTSYELDQRARALLQEGLSVYRVDGERLNALAPDVILTQDHCRVCAASLDEVEDAVRTLVDGEPRVLSLSPRTLDDVLADVERVGRSLELAERGREVSRGLRRRMRGLARTLESRASGQAASTRGDSGRARGSSSAAERPTVVLIEWLEPLMTAGNWMPTLVEMAGGEPLLGRPGEHSPWTPFDELAAADPDVLVVVPCGFGVDRTLREMPALTEREGWSELRAVRADRVYVVDGHHYFNRPGPRLAESQEILAEILHGDRVDFGHRERGWVLFTGARS